MCWWGKWGLLPRCTEGRAEGSAVRASAAPEIHRAPPLHSVFSGGRFVKQQGRHVELGASALVKCFTVYNQEPAQDGGGGGGCIAADVDQASFASLYFSRWNVAAFILSCLSVWPEGWQRQSAGTAALCSKLKPHYCSRGVGGTGGSPGASAHGARRFPWPQFSSPSLQKYVLCFWVEYLWLKSALIPIRANLFHQQTSTKMISADPAYWTFSPQAEQTCPLQELEGRVCLSKYRK